MENRAQASRVLINNAYKRGGEVKYVYHNTLVNKLCYADSETIYGFYEFKENNGQNVEAIKKAVFLQGVLDLVNEPYERSKPKMLSDLAWLM